MLKKLLCSCLMAAFLQTGVGMALDIDYSGICDNPDHYLPANWQRGLLVRYPGADYSVSSWEITNLLNGGTIASSASEDQGYIEGTSGLLWADNVLPGHAYYAHVIKDGWLHRGSQAQEKAWIRTSGNPHPQCDSQYIHLGVPRSPLSRILIPGTSNVTWKRQNGTPVVGAPVEAGVVGGGAYDAYGMHSLVYTNSSGVGTLTPVMDGYSNPGIAQYAPQLWKGGYIFRSRTITNDGTTTLSETIPNDTTFTVRSMGRPVTNAANGLFDPNTYAQINDFNEITDASGKAIYNTTAASSLFAVNIEEELKVFGPFPREQENTIVSMAENTPTLYEPQDYSNYMQDDMMFTWENLSSTPMHLDYLLRIFSDDQLVFQMPFTQNGVVISDFPQGLFTWEVVAFDTEDYAYACSPKFLFGCRLPMSRSGFVEGVQSNSDKPVRLFAGEPDSAKSAGLPVVSFAEYKPTAMTKSTDNQKKIMEPLNAAVKLQNKALNSNTIVPGGMNISDTLDRNKMVEATNAAK